MPIKKIIIIFTILILCFSINAYDYIPGKQQTNPILLKGGQLYTITNGILKNSDILFENGIITQIGTDLKLPENTEIIDVTGKHIYPGLISANSNIGLIEIGAVPATDDRSELGRNNPDVRSTTAYNPDSEIIPTVRSNGITSSLIVPGGSLIRGRSSLLNMDGWTVEDAMVKENVGLHISWPKSSIISAWWMQQTPEEQKKDNSKNIETIYKLFDKAKAYFVNKQANPNIDIDSKMEAMLAVFKKEIPVFVHASDIRQLNLVISFSKKYAINVILVGGSEAWKCADLLKDANIPVILGRTQASPMRQDAGYDLSYVQPKLLFEAGLKFCLSYGSATSERNLPFQAGQAVAFGLSKEEALRSITLSPAEILGVADQLGSLEIGKKATIIVSSGDIMDILGNDILLEFIEGRKVDLNNKHKELYKKYQEKTF